VRWTIPGRLLDAAPSTLRASLGKFGNGWVGGDDSEKKKHILVGGTPTRTYPSEK